MSKITVSIKKKHECVPHDDKLAVDQSTRTRGLEILNSALSDHFTDAELNELETSIHQRATLLTCSQNIMDKHHDRSLCNYNNILKTTVLHLDPTSYIGSDYLLSAIKDGTVALCRVPNLTQQELHPSMWDKQIKYKHAETRQISMGKSVVTSSLIKCGRCGSDTTYTEEQTRSSDEAMTIKVTCPNCGNRFNI